MPRQSDQVGGSGNIVGGLLDPLAAGPSLSGPSLAAAASAAASLVGAEQGRIPSAVRVDQNQTVIIPNHPRHTAPSRYPRDTVGLSPHLAQARPHHHH